jgi:hypothetical protein
MALEIPELLMLIGDKVAKIYEQDKLIQKLSRELESERERCQELNIANETLRAINEQLSSEINRK